MSFLKIGRRELGALLLASCLLPLAGAAQGVTTADVVGAVSDTSGGLLPGVTVTVVHQGTAATRTVVTEGDGQFQVRLLPPGRYRITVELQGFRTSIHEVTLAIGDRFRLDVKLEVGSISETVLVTGESPVLQTQTGAVASLVDERAMQDLPLNGRNFVRLAQITPGVTEGAPNSLSSGNRPDDRRQSSSIQINGQNTQSNNFLIDGLDNNERFIGTVIVRPSVDAIAELRVETSVFSAELGHTVGGVINVVSKSGSNQFHGSAFEFYRNEALDGRNFFAPKDGDKATYRQHQYGGSLGGPIVTGRTFFFGDYGGLRQKQGQNYTATVPTLAMRQGNFSGAANVIYDPQTGQPFPGNVIPSNRLDPAALKWAALYPLPANSNASNNFFFSPLKTQDDDSFDLRIDQRLGDKSLLFGRISYNNTTTVVPNGLPAVDGVVPGGGQSFPGTAEQRAYNTQLSANRVISPTLVFETRFGYARYDSKTLPTNYGINAAEQLGIPGINQDQNSTGLPVVTIAGFTTLGDAGAIPLLLDNHVYQSASNVTYSRGAHSLKAGFVYVHRNVLAFQDGAKGNFAFNANFTSNAGAVGTGNGLASFLLGYPATTTRNKYLVEPHYLFNEYSTFVQYDWRARSWLTLNAGVRYDILPPLTEANNQIANVALEAGKILVAGVDTSSTAGLKTDLNDVAPRLGFAATLGPDTVLRGGYGISYTPGTMTSTGAFRNPPFVSVLSLSPPTFAPGNRLSEGLPFPAPTSVTNPTGNLWPIVPDLKTEYVHQYNVALQRQLPGQVAATVAYVGVLGRDLHPEVGLPINSPLAGPGNINARRPFAQVFPQVLQNFNVRGSYSTSGYQSVQTLLERRFANGWGGRVQYTWSHSTLTAADGQATFTQIPALANPWPEMLEFINYETADQPTDVRHRASVSANYEIGLARNATGLVGALAKGWQVNLVGVMQSGSPFTVTNSTQRANTGRADRPDQVCEPNLPGGDRTVTRWFDTSCFVAQPVNTFGSTRTNTVVGPGLMSFDLSVFKSFAPGGGNQVQLRLEVFNLFNRANFANPDAALGVSSFGVISTTGNNLSRNVQLAVKWLF